ncbi:hypothetical protein BDU57DRAFT_597296 [Ampelomyces quisqualis]|uniref:Retrovirus-related Pol polyprotein from transposon TNT 1-94-like beta-barrel domain-containing protein n=1 Tax=Ampelomyces quisqualis TaxID=50730 RepID=A0A6A5QD37_AMPQU|nr:hypothetical protein BDU57DRAFT_597296 [Ampelomyces quisqualis]
MHYGCDCIKRHYNHCSASIRQLLVVRIYEKNMIDQILRIKNGDSVEGVGLELNCRTHLHDQGYEVNTSLKDFDTEIFKKPIINSGANCHLINNKKWFKTFKEFAANARGKAKAANKSSLKLEGGGTVVFPIQGDDGILRDLELQNVFYCPSARQNIISLGLLI